MTVQRHDEWMVIYGYLQTRYDAMKDGWWIDGIFYSVGERDAACTAAAMHLNVEAEDNGVPKTSPEVQ